MKYFIFNKDMDYRRGIYCNLRLSCGSAALEAETGGAPGVFLSRVLDSGEKGCRWHRLVMDLQVGENMAVFLYLFSTDSQIEAEAFTANRRREELMTGHDQASDPAPLMEQLKPFLRGTFRNPRDILLHQITGRYLWLGLALWGNGAAGPVIREIRLYFPRESWNRYLPEIYQDESQVFLDQFLSIFQSLYMDLETQIRGSSRYLDLGAAPDEVLPWLASWLGVEDSDLWPPERLRSYLVQWPELCRLRGTPVGLIRLVELYTGYPVYLQERAPGDDVHCFRLFIDEAAVAGAREYQALLQVIREGKPADMEVFVIALKPWVFLDQHTYLGINSRLNQYGEAALDCGDSIPYAVLGGNDQ